MNIYSGFNEQWKAPITTNKFKITHLKWYELVLASSQEILCCKEDASVADEVSHNDFIAMGIFLSLATKPQWLFRYNLNIQVGI